MAIFNKGSKGLEIRNQLYSDIALTVNIPKYKVKACIDTFMQNIIPTVLENEVSISFPQSVIFEIKTLPARSGIMPTGKHKGKHWSRPARKIVRVRVTKKCKNEKETE